MDIRSVFLVDPRRQPEWSYGTGPVRPSIDLTGHFLGIVSYVFSKFWHGARNPFEVVCDRAGFAGKNIFATNYFSL